MKIENKNQVIVEIQLHDNSYDTCMRIEFLCELNRGRGIPAIDLCLVRKVSVNGWELPETAHHAMVETVTREKIEELAWKLYRLAEIEEAC